MTSREQQRMDDMVMAVTEMHCFRFVAPDECKAEHDRCNYRPAAPAQPGVYVKAEGHGVSPIARPKNPTRLLTREQALTLAAALDAVAEPQPHMSRMGSRHGRVEHARETFPHCYAAFISRWYEVLADRIDNAVESADERRNELRELRAALRGQVTR